MNGCGLCLSGGRAILPLIALPLLEILLSITSFVVAVILLMTMTETIGASSSRLLLLFLFVAVFLPMTQFLTEVATSLPMVGIFCTSLPFQAVGGLSTES